MDCRHCGKDTSHGARGNGRRGLCRGCYRTPTVRRRYARLWERERVDLRKLDTGPTEFSPGSPEKVLVMMKRVAHGMNPCGATDAGTD